MKLQTSITPRRDGTIKLTGLDGVDYVFKADASNDVVCDIEHGPTIVHLLSTRADFFWPASEDDYAAAKVLLDDADVDIDEPDDEDDDDDGDEPKLPPGADPLAEANTPPAVAPGKGKRVAAAKKTAAPAKKSKA